MANPSGAVKFIYIPTGQQLPATRDSSAIYYVEATKQIYIGAHEIANWGPTEAEVSTEYATKVELSSALTWGPVISPPQA